MKVQITLFLLIGLSFNSFSQQKDKNWLDLNADDTLKIWYRTVGCFHGYEKTVVFYRNDDEIIATHSFDTIILDSSAIEQIAMFQSELGKSSSWGCTTKAYYKVSMNNEEIKSVTDGSCSWRGYNTYIAPLFREEDE